MCERRSGRSAELRVCDRAQYEEGEAKVHYEWSRHRKRGVKAHRRTVYEKGNSSCIRVGARRPEDKEGGRDLIKKKSRKNSRTDTKKKTTKGG